MNMRLSCLGWLICLILAMSLLLAAPALAAPGDTVLFEQPLGGYYSEEGAENTCTLGDTLYIASWNYFYSYKLGDAEPTKLFDLSLAPPWTPPDPDATPAPVASVDGEVAEEPEYDWNDRLTLPFTYQGKVYLINAKDYSFYTLEGDKPVKTELSVDIGSVNISNYSLSSIINGIFEFEGRLYFLVRVNIDDWEAPMELWVIDPEKGTHQTINTELPVKGVCGYEPGKLLCWTQKSFTSGTYNPEDYYPELFVMDAQTGKREGELVKVITNNNSICGLTYDPEAKRIFFAIQNKLMRMDSLSAPMETASYFNRELYQTQGQASILAGTHLVLGTYEGVYLRNLTADPSDGRVLRIGNSYMSDTASGFMRENPDIPIDFVADNAPYSASVDEMTTRLLSGDNSVDIISLDDVSSLKSLMKKGYVMDLSQSEGLAKAYERMYAPLREAVSVDGKPMAFPSSVSPRLWKCNKEKLQEVGLGEFPKTMSELIDMVNRWEDGISQDNPSLVLMEGYQMDSTDQIKTSLMNMVFERYMSEFAKPGEPIRFNTPEFLEVMQKLEAMPGEYIDPNAPTDYSSSYEYTAPIITAYFDIENYNADAMLTSFAYPPRISESSPDEMLIWYSVYVVNPNSPNSDLAVKYLEYMAEHNTPAHMVYLYPDYDTPLEEQWVIENLEWYTKELEELNATPITDENRRDIEQRLQDVQKEMEDVERRRYRISPEGIAQYRQFAEHMTMDRRDGMFSNEAAVKEFYDLVTRYMQGQLKLDQLVRELDQKAQMIFLEQQ